jgi:hypothetical protein
MSFVAAFVKECKGNHEVQLPSCWMESLAMHPAAELVSSKPSPPNS